MDAERGRQSELRVASEAVRVLASIERPSASEGERQAAEWLAGQFTALGVNAEVERERAHGTHWWPFGLPVAAAALAGVVAVSRGGAVARWAAALSGALGTVSLAEDIGGGPRLLRRLLPQRTTYNVVARIGRRDAARTVLLHAHHDAAHGGVIFDPRIARLLPPGEGAPGFLPLVTGPAMVAAGAATGARMPLKAGVALSVLLAAVFTDVGFRRTVPGANDDASGVACLLLLTGRLRADPLEDTQVILLSTGSEESLLEGMTAFARRHFGELPAETTTAICIDPVGWPHLSLRTTESDWRRYESPAELIELFKQAGQAHGIDLSRTFPGAPPTDGLIAHRAGYSALTVGSVDSNGAMSDYHTHRDRPDRMASDSIVDAAILIEQVLRSIDADAAPVTSVGLTHDDRTA